MKTSNWLRASAVAITCALSACGGGGGGSNPVDNVTVTADRNSVALIALNSSGMSTEPVYFTISGGKGTYYVSAAGDNDAFSFDFQAVSDTEAAVTGYAIDTIAPGMRSSGHITYKLCTDEQCHHVAWSRAIPYTMTRYAVDVSPLGLASTEAATPAPVTLAVTPSDVDHQLTFTSSNTAVVTADHTDPTKVVLALQPQGAGVHAYTADVSIGFQTALSVAPGQADIPVSLTIGAGITAPAIGGLFVTATSTAASVTGQAPVTFASGQNAAWSASADRDWLVLDTASGTGAGSIAYHVDATRLAGVPNWGSDTATLTISAAGMTAVSTSVTLHKQLPEITTVSPAAVLAGQPSTVHVTGRGLAQLTSTSAILAGGTHPVGGGIGADGSATLEFPALAAGSVVISVPNALGVPTNVAALAVTSAGTFAAATVANTGSKHAIAFDATRNAVFAANQQQGSLVRFQLVGSQWQVSSLPLPTIGRLALSPDRRTVYVASGANLVEVDPDTMQARTIHGAPFDLWMADGFNYADPLPMTNDMRLWFVDAQAPTMTYFDMISGTFGNQDLGPIGGDTALWSPAFYASPDGSQLMVANCQCGSVRRSFWYDPETDSVLARANEPAVILDAKFDVRGSVILVDDERLYRTDTFALIGNATIANGAIGGNAVISPDGTRIYRAVFAGEYVVDHLEVFDTTTLAAGQTSFVDLGAIALPDKAVNCPSVTADCDYPGRMAVDPTGTTLFWAGDAGLVVVPIPPALSGIAGTGRAHATDTARMRSALPPKATLQARPTVRGRLAH